MKALRYFLLIGMAALCYGFQVPEGTADHCDNSRGTKAMHKCACRHATECPKEGEQGDEPGAKCKTYCHPEKCGCMHSCKIT